MILLGLVFFTMKSLQPFSVDRLTSQIYKCSLWRQLTEIFFKGKLFTIISAPGQGPAHAILVWSLAMILLLFLNVTTIKNYQFKFTCFGNKMLILLDFVRGRFNLIGNYFCVQIVLYSCFEIERGWMIRPHILILRLVINISISSL